jgi:hypothetical protein
MVVFAGIALANIEPPLPTWNGDERTLLEAEGWVAGGSLLAVDPPVPEDSPAAAVSPELDVAQPTAEEVAEADLPGSVIPEKFLPLYFGERPQEFLVDPQGLLSEVDYRNRLEFLKDHSADSSIDLFVYVFGGEQDIPSDVRAEELIERFFSSGRPAAMVYYYLGAPQRSVMYLSPSLTEGVPVAEQRRALQSSVMMAFEKLDPVEQLEAFSVQMSIRIYWMERMLGGQVVTDDLPEMNRMEEVGEAAPVKKSREQWLEEILKVLDPLLMPVALTSLSVVIAFSASWWLNRRRRYRFPEFDVEPRLGGNHAAGIGAVISFASATLPPASQRDQVPDYLRRA